MWAVPWVLGAAAVQTSLGEVGPGVCDGGVCRWLSVPFAEPLARFGVAAVRSTAYLQATQPTPF